VSQQCRAREQALDANVPSVVPVAIDENGSPVEAVEVWVDGVLRSTQINGRALPMDPGLHEFRLSAKDRVPYVEKLLVAQGEHSRRLSAVLRPIGDGAAADAAIVRRFSDDGSDEAPALAAPPVPAPPVASLPALAAPTQVAVATEQGVGLEPTRHGSVGAYVAGGTAVAAFGISIAFATWGHLDNELLDGCAPNCPQDSVDHVRNMYIAADVSLGVGVVALGVATWLYLSEPARDDRADHAQYHFDLQPSVHGAFASWEHEF
jgi:hypothetical protein